MTPNKTFFIILAALIVSGCTTNKPKPEAQQPKAEAKPAPPPKFEFYTFDPRKPRP
jgi:PBP1b-binding outer membrane lipoprotein LpoB